MQTFSDLLRLAKVQSALDIGCNVSDFDISSTVLVPIRKKEGQKSYFSENDVLLASYGQNVAGCVPEKAIRALSELFSSMPFYRCFELPAIGELNEILLPFGLHSAFLAEMFLPDPQRLAPLPCGYESKIITDFSPFYLPQWSNALSMGNPSKDRLGVGMFDGGKLIGLAACSADCETMWQIGVDVLPEYRRQGIASALVSRLAIEILRAGKVPFYSVAWSNLPSKRTAMRCGFVPSWVELSAVPIKTK